MEKGNQGDKKQMRKAALQRAISFVMFAMGLLLNSPAQADVLAIGMYYNLACLSLSLGVYLAVSSILTEEPTPRQALVVYGMTAVGVVSFLAALSIHEFPVLAALGEIFVRCQPGSGRWFVGGGNHVEKTRFSPPRRHAPA